MALDAVVFDVDGTLVDSERDGHRVAFNVAFEEAGLPDRWDVPTYGRLLRIAGGAQRMTAWFVEQGRGPDEAADLASRLHRRKTAIMREIVEAGRIQARPGVHELLDRLDAGGVPTHVATTGTRTWVEPLLHGLFGERFGTIVTGTEVPELKPSPAAYLEVLRRAGLAPSAVVAVEDSENGVRAAVAAGLPCVAAYNGYTREQDLSGAEVIAPSLDAPEIVTWFDGRLR